MRFFVSMLVLSLMAGNAFAAQSRLAMSNKVMSAPRYTASIKQLGGMNIIANTNGQDNNNTMQIVTGTDNPSPDNPNPDNPTPDKPEIDQREAEREACISNNIGIGNTFVWASKYSNTSNYATMVEDVEHPENNVCFVRVELKSNDESRISVSDIPAKYFMWGENIECGGWVNEKDMQQRILDAKKGNRIGGIVASSVGGAALGVGAMELFGNRLIGGAVEGQKTLLKNNQMDKLYRSQLLVLRDKDSEKFNRYMEDLAAIKKACVDEPKTMNEEDCAKYLGLIGEMAEFIK